MWYDRLPFREIEPLYWNFSIGGHGLASPITFLVWTCSAVSEPETQIAIRSRRSSALRVWASSAKKLLLAIACQHALSQACKKFHDRTEKIRRR
jgi:hypothetical protein